MKTFIKNVILFISLLLGLILLIEFSTSAIVNKNANFKLASKPKYIILGHSHPECALNDSLLPGFKNLAHSGESYFYTYFKVKKVLEQNPSIETVFIEYTNNQIESRMNNWIWSDGPFSDCYVYYSSFMPLSDQFILFQNNMKGYLNAFSYSNKYKISALTKGDYDFKNRVGGYLYLVRNKTDSLLKHPIKQDYKNNPPINNSKDISETNLLY